MTHTDIHGCSTDITDGDEEQGRECPSDGEIDSHKSNPVNIINGNKIEYVQDLFFNSPFKGGLTFKRYYNSQSDAVGPAGYGWSHNYAIQLYPSHGPDRIKIKRGDGRGLYFYLNTTTGQYEGLLSEKSWVETDGTSFTWHPGNGFEYGFDQNGVLQEIRDGIANRQLMAYDGVDPDAKMYQKSE